MTVTNESVVFVPNLYASGGVLGAVTNTTVSYSSGAFRDSTNIFDIVISEGVIVNAAVNGAGGLDQGSLVADTMYYVYAIGSTMSAQPSNYMISLSMTTPLMPVGYDVLRLIGFLITDNSSHFEKCYVSGTGRNRTHWWDTAIELIADGDSTTFFDIDLAIGVPPIDNTLVKLTINFAPAIAGSFVVFAPGGITPSASLPTFSSTVVGITQTGEINILSKLNGGAASIQYKNAQALELTTVKLVAFNYVI